MTDDVTGYGIPDLSTLNFAKEGLAMRLQNRLEAAIRAFEPRLANPRVTIAPSLAEPDILAMTIDAELAGETCRLDLELPRRS